MHFTVNYRTNIVSKMMLYHLCNIEDNIEVVNILSSMSMLRFNVL